MLIAPVFDFNGFLYETVCNLDRDELEALQNSCHRVCLNKDRYTHRSELFETAKVNPLDVQYKIKPAIL